MPASASLPRPTSLTVVVPQSVASTSHSISSLCLLSTVGDRIPVLADTVCGASFYLS